MAATENAGSNRNNKGGTGPEHSEAIDVIASMHPYEGSAVFRDVATGYATTSIAAGANPFVGFAEEEIDNSASLDPTTGKPLICRYDHLERVTVTGITIANVGDVVYASDNFTFTLTAAGNTPIGEVAEIVRELADTCYVNCKRLENLL